VKIAFVFASMAAAVAALHEGCEGKEPTPSPPPSDASAASCISSVVPKNQNGYWEKKDLPSGSCTPSDARCSALIEDACPGYFPRGALDGWECSCANGTWGCSIIQKGMATCGMPEAGPDS
jgi:hypothetical protein